MAIEAKHLRPRLDHVSLRPEARDALAAAFDRRLTVVCAPAGYGKTTTTAAVLDLSGCPAAWYKLDILDHDPLAFLAAMTRAVQRLLPGFGVALLRELESGPVPDIPPQALAAQFCAEADRLVSSRIHLILDDYHETMDAPAMNDVLGYLLDNCPETIRFIVLTRYEPTFRLEKLRLAGEVARVPRDLFLFDAGQVGEVLRQRSGKRHDPEHVRRLHALTEGWPASVVLAGMALAWFDAASLEEALGDPRLRMDVFSYLAEQVFQRQTAQVQRFLLRTCCLEHVNAELGERLTGTSSASRHLHFLAKNQVFTFDTGRGGTYRYHNLLRDFLRQRFVQDEGEGAFRALQRETAVALEACGDRPGAVELLLGANEADLALGVIARGGEAELERRPYEQLRLWASRLAPAADSGQPWALVVSAVLDIRESLFSRGLESLRRAIEALDGHGDHNGLYQALSIMEWAEFWSGDSAASMATCRRALDSATSDAQRLHTLLSLMSAALDMRDWDAVASASSRAETLMHRARPEETARAQALRAHAAYFQGDMRLAHDLAQHPHDHGRMATQRAAALNIRGMIETALGQYDVAASHLMEAMETAADFGHALTTWMIEDSYACLKGARGRIPDALMALEALGSDAAHVQEPSLQAYAFCHRGTILRRAGDVRASLDPTRAAAELAPVQRDPYLALNAEANVAFAEGLLGVDTRGALGRASRKASEAGLRFVELKSTLFDAVLSHLASDITLTTSLLESCLPSQLELGHINLIAQELGPRPELAALILRRHRSNGLGPALVEALSHYWLFPETAETLRQLCPSQVGTWIDHMSAGNGRTGPRGTDLSHAPWPASPSHSSAGSSALNELTPREREVLELMAADRTNDEIAADLFIAIPTVKTHINHIRRKLDQTTRVGAVLEYQRLKGLVAEGHEEQTRLHLHPPK